MQNEYVDVDDEEFEDEDSDEMMEEWGEAEMKPEYQQVSKKADINKIWICDQCQHRNS